LLAVFVCLLAMPVVPANAQTQPAFPPPETSIQAFLEAVPGVLKSLRDNGRSAAEHIRAASAYYGVSPRLLLALLEASSGLLSDPNPPPDRVRRPFGTAGPDGFGAQIDWAAAELRAGYGPYDQPPVVTLSDGTQATITLQQAPEGVAVQRLLARGRTRATWTQAVERFNQAFQRYFNNQLIIVPDLPPAAGWLLRPWPAGTRVTHLAYFDHQFPTVDAGRRDNGYVVNYLGRGGVQYDGHDGNDYVFPDQPIGTPILAAADGVAYASTHRGNGVWIRHAGGYETVYWHLDRFAPVFTGLIDSGKGVSVRAGDQLGTSGRSGFVAGTPHLHFEVRYRGKQVDPYGWFGPGPDPCPAYAGCAASTWLWHPSLVGEFNFTPPAPAVPDTLPPTVRMTVNPRSDLLFYTRFDDTPLQLVGSGAPIMAGVMNYHTNTGLRTLELGKEDRLAYPTAGNLDLDQGTLSLRVVIPERYPGTRYQYLLAASAHPDSNPIFTNTLALRRERGSDGRPRWNFWTTSARGLAGQHELFVPDNLQPGVRHLALMWERATGSKRVYVDGQLVASVDGVELPDDVGDLLAIGRYSPGAGTSGIRLAELAIFNRMLAATEVEALATAAPTIGGTRLAAPNVILDVNALDDSSSIVAVQVGVDGKFSAPQPFADGFRVVLPNTVVGQRYTLATRILDRAGNQAVISTTLEMVAPPQVVARFEQQNGTTRMQIQPATDVAAVQLATSPDLANAPWRTPSDALPWRWERGANQVLWGRARSADGVVGPIVMLGPSVKHVYLPLTIKR
jgi:murein DD-endopeptidase MepM/ murein hydrolase activator NlpD